MSKESNFFVYLLEQYAIHKNTTADEVLKLLESKGLVDFVYDMYEIYHTEILENAFADMDSLIEGGKPTWQNFVIDCKKAIYAGVFMKGYIEERVVEIAYYIIENNAFISSISLINSSNGRYSPPQYSKVSIPSSSKIGPIILIETFILLNASS